MRSRVQMVTAALPPVALVLLLLAGLAHAGDELAEKDPRVLGRSYFGVHMGRKNIGWCVVDVTATTSGSESYHSFAQVSIAVGGDRERLEETGLLDRRLAPALLEQREAEGANELRLARRIERKKEGGFVVLRDGKKTDVAPGRPLVEGLASTIAFLRALDSTRKASLRIATLAESGLSDVEVDITGVADEKLRVVLVKVAGTGQVTRYLLDPAAPPAKRVVRWKQLESELEFVLAPDEAGAKKDLPPPPRPKEGTPRAAILAYLEAVEKRDAKKLEPLLDWSSVHRSLGEKGDVEKWKKQVLEQVATREDHDEHGEHGKPEDLIPRLVEEQTTPEALDARVRIEGEKGVFKLVREKPGAPWKIAQLPD